MTFASELISYRPIFLGDPAAQLLQGTVPASVMGATSKGVFLLLAERRMVFLSREQYRGPLTVNLPDLPDLGLVNGAAAAISDGVIRLSSAVIDTTGAEHWRARLLNPPLPEPGNILARLRHVARRLVDDKQGAGLSGLLGALLKLPDAAPIDDPQLLADLQTVRATLGAGDVQTVGPLLTGCLGRGGGLTPSGDDLVLGFLLAISHCRGWFGADESIEQLSAQLVAQAARSTTTLSANLIAMAVLGQADERLIAALSGVVTGKPEPAAVASGLASWGNSSGADALVGMTLVLTSLPE